MAARKIWLLGDVHAKFEHVERQLAQTPKDALPTAIIFLGDIEPTISFEDCIQDILTFVPDVWWIRGNHDTDSTESWRNFEGSMHRNIDGKVIKIGDRLIAGLGGVFRGEVWYPRHSQNALATGQQFRSYSEYEKDLRQKQGIKHRLNKMDSIQGQAVPSRQGNADLLDVSKTGRLLKNLTTIFPDDYDRLANSKADILLTHEAPGQHPNGFEELTVLAQSMGCRVFAHGHQHDCLVYPAIGDLQGYGIGLRGISSLDTGTMKVLKILDGELDFQRSYRQERMEP